MQANPPQSANLFVAGLSADVTDAGLEAAFGPFGKILSAKVMLDIHTGHSRGFGFVLFELAESSAAAMEALQGQRIGQKSVHISFAQTSGNSALQHTPKLYVRNVPRNKPLDELRQYFSQYGKIERLNIREDATMPDDTHNQEPSRDTVILFLEYSKSEEAAECVRKTHNSRPWPGLGVPLLAKPAETTQMRNERKTRQASRKPGDAVRAGSGPSSPNQSTQGSISTENPFTGSAMGSTGSGSFGSYYVPMQALPPGAHGMAAAGAPAGQPQMIMLPMPQPGMPPQQAMPPGMVVAPAPGMAPQPGAALPPGAVAMPQQQLPPGMQFVPTQPGTMPVFAAGATMQPAAIPGLPAGAPLPQQPPQVVPSPLYFSSGMGPGMPPPQQPR